MKYLILVGDGMADWPIPQLDNQTVLEAANIPNMNWLASHGQMGLLKTIPDSMSPGSEVANMSIMGYHPETDLTGRGALEALSAGVSLSPDQIAFRCNIITITDGLIDDYAAGHITSEEAAKIIKDLNSKFHEPELEFFPGVQYRHILRVSDSKFSENIICTPPHDQLGKPYQDFLIQAKDPEDEKACWTAEHLNELIERTSPYLLKHPVNIARKKKGEKMATHIWPWSPGKKPAIQSFAEKFGKTGSVISAVDLIFGIGIAAGLEPIHVEGATGLPDTNYIGKAEAAIETLQQKDFVYVHIEAPDEMGHAADWERKKQSIEDIDEKVLGTILNAKDQFEEGLSIALLPDHPTPCEIRTHARDPVPFVFYNSLTDSEVRVPERRFIEASGKDAELGLIPDGESFMKLFLGIA
jgi:2,3-bisphosphoglycerate-independent phosphoglycerate mutase